MIFGAAFFAGDYYSQNKRWAGYNRFDPNLQKEIQGEAFVDYGLGADSISHLAYYYGWGESIENARKADVFLLGNSRTLCGFSERLLSAFGKEKGIQFFNFGFGHGETSIFPEYVMKKHGLKPKVVIANANNFFKKNSSDFAETFLMRSAWSMFRDTPEDFATYYYYRYLRQHFPLFSSGIAVSSETAYVRSEIDGSYKIWNLKKEGVSFSPNTDVAKKEEYDFFVALDFKEFIEGYGGRLFLTFVPYPEGNELAAKELAKRLGVDYIEPSWGGLEAFDGSHLDERSKELFTEKFLKKLASIF